MCNPCCLIIGCDNFKVPISTPNGYPEPPRKVICPSCNAETEAVYMKEVVACALCFIPCCPVNSSEPFLACKKCHFLFGGISTEACDRCGLSVNNNANYCPSCGTSRRSSRSRHQTYGQQIYERNRANNERNEENTEPEENGNRRDDKPDSNHRGVKIKDLKNSNE